MVNGGISGPAGVPRPLASCNQQVVIVLEGRYESIDLNDIEESIENEITKDVSVSVRGPVIEGTKEIVVAIRSSIISEDTVDAIVSQTNQSLIQQNVGLSIDNWRIEA